MPTTEQKNNSGISSRTQEVARAKNAPSKDAKIKKKSIIKQTSTAKILSILLFIFSPQFAVLNL